MSNVDPRPEIPLAEFNEFPRYQTREEYEQKTGKPCPPWNPSPERRPKYWEDPTAMSMPGRQVFYPRVILINENGKIVPGTDGAPQLVPFGLPKSEAATVNIPPTGTNIEGADRAEVEMPLKPIEPPLKLALKMGGYAVVQNTVVAEAQHEGFTPGDRALLQGIARRLGL